MKCPNPRKTESRGTHPCGGCLICRKNKGRFWTSRILLEQMATPQLSWFVTLTYNDEHVPRTPEGDLTLRKKQTCQWVQDQTKELDFRYYLVGEYGDENRRPHYHLAVFPGEKESLQTVNALMAKWDRRGLTSAHPLQKGSAEYLAKYTVKKLTAPDDERLLPGQEPEFRTSSRDPALGLRAVEPLVSAYETRQGALVLAERGDVERTVRINGKRWPLDNYMLKKMRTALGVPLKHAERLNHEGYYRWHQNPELEENLPLLDREKHRYAQKKASKQAKRL